MPRRKLNNLHVLVTGASSGIGRALAIQLAQSGSHVLAVARRAHKLEELSKQISEPFSLQQSSEHARDSTVDDNVSDDARSLRGVGQSRFITAGKAAGTISTLVADITHPEDRQRCLAWCQSNWGKLDVLINNAGSGAIGRFDTSSTERIRKLMEVDFFGPVELTRLFLPLLCANPAFVRPAIVIVGSVLSHRAVPLKSEYCAAKFALRGWAESLRCELASQNIEVLQIDPSTTRSEFFDSLIDTPAGTESRSIGSMSPERVAAITIRAIEKSKRRTIISLGGKALVTLSRWFPGIVDRILSK